MWVALIFFLGLEFDDVEIELLLVIDKLSLNQICVLGSQVNDQYTTFHNLVAHPVSLFRFLLAWETMESEIWVYAIKIESFC